MTDWQYAQTDPRQQLARLHFFSIKKLEGEKEIEMVITVKETAGALQMGRGNDKRRVGKCAVAAC